MKNEDIEKMIFDDGQKIIDTLNEDKILKGVGKCEDKGGALDKRARKPKKKFIAILSSALAAVIIACIIVPVVMLGANKNVQNLDKTVIKNWSSYNQIGAGYVGAVQSKGEANSQLNKISVARNNSPQGGKPKLFGIKKDGTYETVVFLDQDNGEKQQTMYLSGFTAFRNFIFVRYSEEEAQNGIGMFTNSAGNHSYVISKEGMVFGLNEVFDSNSINLYTVGFYGESDDSVFFVGNKKGETNQHIYKISVENNELKVEKVVDKDVFESFSNTFTVDKYGNVFSEDKKVVVTTKRNIKSVSATSCFIGMNGIMYADDKAFNADGDLVETDFVPTDTANLSGINNGRYGGATHDSYLIKREGNDYYYYTNNNGSSFDDITTIYKYSFSGEKYTLTRIKLEDFPKGMATAVIANDKIYFYATDQLYSLEITDGKKTVISTEYYINKIWSDNKGNILFNGINASMNTVNGIINADGKMQTGITYNGYDVIYIKAI